ncbi:penicillin acylase family protein, partial [Rhizobium johnstonii]|uniref:penicillin acylase family protein n=1 Tax=Rhizobium johnstonii TaxID=3019933 RepID=UPI003F9D6237
MGGQRWFSVFGSLLSQPDSPWWTNEKLGISGEDEMLAYAAEKAWDEGVSTMGSDVSRWRWGTLHTLELTNATFGVSGVAPIEWLFNRGPYEVGGGSSVVNAVGWSAQSDT